MFLYNSDTYGAMRDGCRAGLAWLQRTEVYQHARERIVHLPETYQTVSDYVKTQFDASVHTAFQYLYTLKKVSQQIQARELNAEIVSIRQKIAETQESVQQRRQQLPQGVDLAAVQAMEAQLRQEKVQVEEEIGQSTERIQNGQQRLDTIHQLRQLEQNTAAALQRRNQAGEQTHQEALLGRIRQIIGQTQQRIAALQQQQQVLLQAREQALQNMQQVTANSRSSNVKLRAHAVDQITIFKIGILDSLKLEIKRQETGINSLIANFEKARCIYANKLGGEFEGQLSNPQEELRSVRSSFEQKYTEIDLLRDSLIETRALVRNILNVADGESWETLHACLDRLMDCTNIDFYVNQERTRMISLIQLLLEEIEANQIRQDILPSKQRSTLFRAFLGTIGGLLFPLCITSFGYSIFSIHTRFDAVKENFPNVSPWVLEYIRTDSDIIFEDKIFFSDLFGIKISVLEDIQNFLNTYENFYFFSVLGSAIGIVGTLLLSTEIGKYKKWSDYTTAQQIESHLKEHLIAEKNRIEKLLNTRFSL